MPTSVRLSAEIEKRLAALAARTGRSKAFHVRAIIENGLGDIEDYYVAMEVMERLRRGILARFVGYLPGTPTLNAAIFTKDDAQLEGTN
jgi:RHH-type rel operon transcriptional repressor/antitoxin RelB